DKNISGFQGRFNLFKNGYRHFRDSLYRLGSRETWVGAMITIGIRAAPKCVTFAIYDTEAKSVLNVEEIKIPAAFETPAALKYVRSNLLDVLREYQVERAGVRVTESVASSNIERIQ